MSLWMLFTLLPTHSGDSKKVAKISLGWWEFLVAGGDVGGLVMGDGFVTSVGAAGLEGGGFGVGVFGLVCIFRRS